jgi:Mitochondrial ribosomal protein subunit
LLRSSRVFSIPPPLPKPVGDLSSQAIFTSDTSTLPHPTHQTITTPQSSLAKGDWGFKRPLPLRSTTRTSTPFIRVKAIDTYEHITEFNSSADHALSLQKWQEMGVPLTIPVLSQVKGSYRPSSPRKSVFDSDVDSTTADQSTKEEKRWKFKGPWLAGQTQGDFNTYVATEVRNRKLEFQDFMRVECAKALTHEAKRIATAAGETEEPPPTIEASDVTEEQFTNYVKTLRTERLPLYKLVRSFLDLPPAPQNHLSDSVLDLLTKPIHRGKSVMGTDIMDSPSPYAQHGPPKTHPSAGLAYSRSSAHIYNHPVFGPQKSKPPVKGRVVMPRGAATGSFQAALGVGGFVAELPNSGFRDDFTRKNFRKASVIPGSDRIEPDKAGGSKSYFDPTSARIDPKGRVLLNVELADAEAVAVLEGTTDQIPQSPPMLRGSVLRSTGISSPASGNAASRGYGLDYGLSDRGEGPPRPNYPASLSQEDATKALGALLNEQ